MATTSSPTALRDRRERAAKFFHEGLTQAEVARRCGVTRMTAMRWQRAWIERGKKDLEEPRSEGDYGQREEP